MCKHRLMTLIAFRLLLTFRTGKRKLDMSDPHTHQLTLLSGMAMLLQSCFIEAELFDVAYWYLPRLFFGCFRTDLSEGE